MIWLWRKKLAAAYIAVGILVTAAGSVGVIQYRQAAIADDEARTQAIHRLVPQPVPLKAKRQEARRLGARLTELIEHVSRGDYRAWGTNPQKQRQRLAEQLKIGNQHDVTYIETGERMLSQVEIKRICAIYGVPETWFSATAYTDQGESQ